MTTSNKAIGIWDAIASKGICEVFKLPDTEVLIAPKGMGELRWLIGTHGDLHELAKQFRTDESLWAILAEKRVRFGFRASDRPPIGLTRQRSYGDPVITQTHTHLPNRKTEMHKPVDGVLSPWRISDQLANVKSFWQTQTFQAHHIVEFNNLKSLGLSTENGTEDLDYKGLPCVLLSAELHQRYVSSVLKHTHKSGQDPETCLNGLEKEYKALYGGSESALQPLWEISQIVLAAAKHELQRKKGKR